MRLDASTAPTDRSMPPVMITSAEPTAMMPMSDTWLKMLTMLRVVRK